MNGKRTNATHVKLSLFIFSLIINILPAHSADSLDFSITVTSPSNTPDAVMDVVLDSICPDISGDNTTGTSNLKDVCDYYATSEPAQAVEITKELSAKVNTSANTYTTKTPTMRQTRDIGSRLLALRNTTKQGKLNGNGFARNNGQIPMFNAQDNNEVGGLYSQRLSGFVNVNNINATQLETLTEIGYESESSGLSLGLDYRTNSKTFIGVASQIFKTSATLTDKGSQLEASQIGISLYGTFLYRENWYFEGVVSTGQQILDITRQIDLNLNQALNTTAKGNTNSQQSSLYVGTGYEIPLQYGISSLFAVGLSYTTSKIAAYTESNAGNLGLEISEQELTSLSSSINAYISKVFSTSFGVIIPQLSAGWIHETKTEDQKIAAKFINDNSNTKFVFYTPPPDTNYFIIGLDLQILMPQGRMAFIKYANVQQLRDKSEYALAAGLRMEF